MKSLIINKLIRTLLILPIVSFSSLPCESKPRIVTTPHPMSPSFDITINCTDELWLNETDGGWESPENT